MIRLAELVAGWLCASAGGLAILGAILRPGKAR